MKANQNNLVESPHNTTDTTNGQAKVKYVRVKVGSARFILKNPRNMIFLGTECVTGISVDKEGQNIASENANQRKHIIELSMVDSVTPMVMNNKYGYLEPAILI